MHKPSLRAPVSWMAAGAGTRGCVEIGELAASGLRRLKRAVGAIGGELTADRVHRLRGACRRLETLIGALSPAGDRKAAKLIKALRWTHRKAGRVRDLDVSRAELARLVPVQAVSGSRRGVGVEVRRAARVIDRALREERKEEARELRRALGLGHVRGHVGGRVGGRVRRRVRRLHGRGVRVLGRMVEPARRVGSVVSGSFGAMVLAAGSAASGATGSGGGGTRKPMAVMRGVMHRARLAAKRARDLAEALALWGGVGAKGRGELGAMALRARELSEALGAARDVAMLMEKAERIIAEQNEPGSFEGLRRRLAAAERNAGQRAARALRRVIRGGG